MGMLDELKALGVNVDEAIARLGGNENLYKKLLGSLVKAVKEHYVAPDFDGSDYQETIERAHAIKGTTGNLSVTPMAKAYTEIVDLLRADQPEEARSVLQDILPVQEEIMQCIAKYM